MTGLKQRLHRAWQVRLEHWLNKRAPRATSINLNHKNLYVFPNSGGLLFLITVIITWLLGTNYQNNLILAVSYLLVSLFIVSIYHAYANLAGLRLSFVQAQPNFAGEMVTFSFQVTTNSKAGSEHIELRWPGEPSQILSLEPTDPQIAKVWATSLKRGYFRPGRLLVQSRFPLGIIRCWTWLDLNAVALIYPVPVAAEEPLIPLCGGAGADGLSRRGGDEFFGVRDYRSGDSTKQIAWKHFAQNKGLFTKEYHQVLATEKWLEWDSLSQPEELRLSILCYWAMEYHRRHLSYGLRLPGVCLEPTWGEAHYHTVLAKLATFNLTQGESDGH